jgi:hypothetical protein
MNRWVVVKACLGGVGLAAGLFGMALGWRWLVWGGLVLLAAAFMIRFGERRTR